MSLTVVQLVPNLEMGGVERGTVEFACYLKQQGYRAIVISGGGRLVADLSAQGIEYIVMDIGKKSLFTLRLIPQLKQQLMACQADIVHARSRLPAWLAYQALKKQPRPPYFITTLHGLHSVNRYASVMARGDAVIAVSETAKAYLQNHFSRYLKAPPKVIYRGVDEQQFRFGHQPNKQWLAELESRFPALINKQKVLLPGRLTAGKGFENIIPWLQQADHNQCLLVTAEPQHSNYTRRMAEQLQQQQLSERVFWIGPQSQMADLYAYADLTVSVNRKPESFGRTVLESLTVGTPVVGLNQGGVAEVLSELFIEGLVELDQPQQLINKINQFLTEPATVTPQNSFSNEQQFAQTIALYKNLMAGNL